MGHSTPGVKCPGDKIPGGGGGGGGEQDKPVHRNHTYFFWPHQIFVPAVISPDFIAAFLATA